MGKKNKLQKFAELFTFPNVYQNMSATEVRLMDTNGEGTNLQGKWCKEHFKNENPLVLELACGKGDYVRELARAYPDRNFIGMDLKGNRIWRGASDALEEGLNNAAFLRSRIELLDGFFAEGEVNEIWITFPDPYLRPSKAGKRLTAPRFLDLYRKVLKKGGIVHLKTDDPTLYEFTLETLNELKLPIAYQNDNIYASDLAYPELRYKTFYEHQHLANGRTIKYVRFGL